MTHDSVFRMIGGTPCLRVGESGGVPILMKLEGANPTGSIKDRACAFMLQSAIAAGEIRPGQMLLDASSGNFACALAFFGRALGHPATVVVTSKLTDAKRDFLVYLGATIHRVGTFTIEANTYCRRLASEDIDKYAFLDQLHNWRNPEAHFRTTGPEILAAVPDVRMIVGSLGSGGTMAGIARYVKSIGAAVEIVVVECATGNRIPGTGTFVDGDYRTPFICTASDEGWFDHAVQVTEAEAAAESERLLSAGVFAGLQSGGVMGAARRSIVDRKPAGPVVVLSGDAGWKNLDKLLVCRQGRAHAQI